MPGPIAELSRQLLDAGDGELLGTALDRLDQLEGRAAHEEAGQLLRAFHESGEVSTLREALDEDRLARWADETCTSSEERALALQLRRWLGLESGEAGPDDPARLVVLPALPADPEALVRWARAYDVVSELMRPVEEVLAIEPLGAESFSLLEACCPEFAKDPKSPAAHAQLTRLWGLEPRARSYLRAQAAEAKALAAREQLWRQAWPNGPLRTLGERLRALTPEGAPRSLHALRFVPGRPVTLDPATGVCRGFLPHPSGNFAVRLWLSGYEQRAIEGRCEHCASGDCLHVAALAGRLIDACLFAEDGLRRNLREFVSVPSWQRFVDALAATPSQARGASARRAQLSFVVRESDSRYSVGVFRHRGGGANGKLMSPRKLLRASELEDRDRAALEALATRTRTLGPQFVRADGQVLRSLVGHPHVLREEDGSPLDVREEPLDVELIERADGLSPRVSLAGAPIRAGARDDFVVSSDRARKRLVVAALPPGVQRLLGALEHFRGVLPKESYPALAARIAELSSVARVSIPDALVGYEHPPPEKLLLRISPRLEEGVELALTVRVFPLSPLWIPGEGAERVEGLVGGSARFTRRDLRAERERAERASTALGLSEHMSTGRYAYQIDTHAAALEVLSRAAQLHELLELEWAEPGRGPRITQHVSQSDLQIRLWKRGRWMMLEGAAKSGEAELAIGRLLEAVRRGERFVQIEGTSYAEIERALFERLQDAQLGVSRHDRELALALAAAPSFMEQLGDQVRPGDAESRAWLERLQKRHEPLDAALRLPLDAQLRGYQREGVRFLLQLARWSSGACLADDMGLGKTVQAISLLLQRAELGPALVVAPTSLLGNWANELARFAPELRALVYRGPERERLLGQLGPGSVLVLSYEIALRDVERLKPVSFATQVVDEAQIIRNARTRRARAIAEIPADFRVALTGTPIENRLGDLWSLFALIAPGLLGSWARFRALFAVPIERYEDSERAARLRRLVAPFMLRRTKDEVAPELPARTEVVHVIALSEPEQQLYRAALLHARQALGRRKRHASERPLTVYILAELTKLRQLACHPRLVLADSRIESSKLHALLGLFEDILPRGHRVLVFSQFTTHLALVREALEARGISLLYLDGSTPGAERALLVEQFQAGTAEVFLISLKAGGTGLNLTAADYVVHLDPWWNPAAEDQASDRAHRIGQHKPVTIVKLVSQGTIEERVLSLHEHKRRLAADVLTGDAVSGELDEEALAALLSD